MPHHDFWRSSGFHLLRRDDRGHLTVTEDFLRAYLLRPEMLPEPGSCAAEIALHEALLADPRRHVEDSQVTALADPDAQDNYRVLLRFRDRLVAAGTLEAAYIDLFRGGAVDLPPLFVDHLVHAILRNLLDGADDPFRLRAAELLFRAQRVTLKEGAILVGDDEAVAQLAETGEATLDVLNKENAGTYWRRSDRFDTVLDLSFGRAGLDALCRVLEAWIAHFLAAEVQIEPVGMIRDERWSWHVGLDAEASAILDDLYRGQELDEARLGRLLSLFRLTFRDPAAMRPDLAGRPAYLGMAMTESRRLRLKPQNLLVNLPLPAPT